MEHNNAQFRDVLFISKNGNNLQSLYVGNKIKINHKFEHNTKMYYVRSLFNTLYFIYCFYPNHINGYFA